MLFSSLTTALALASSAVAIPTFGLEPRQAAALDAAMKARGRAYIGTSLTIRNDNTEQNIIKSNEFGSITPENAMKWDATEPNRGQFNWGAADGIANFATQNRKEMRCHTLGERLTRGDIISRARSLTSSNSLVQPASKLGEPDQQQCYVDECHGEP